MSSFGASIAVAQPRTEPSEALLTADKPAYVAVVGAGDAPPECARQAEEVGRELARGGAVVVCGGLGGVMEAACRGAKAEGGTTLGILPGTDRRVANAWVDVAVATGLGELRNGLVVHAVDAVVAVGGEYGTLTEIALALKAGKPVVGVGTWDIPGIVPVDDPATAARTALDLTTASDPAHPRP